MPGIPLIARETCSYSRSGDQMCREDGRVHLSEEEEIAAEESLSVYCKPVELYNILQRRANYNPMFLQRCLHYKIQAKHKRRLQMAVSLPAGFYGGVPSQNIFPLYVLLARLVSDRDTQSSAIYRFSRACILTSFDANIGNTQAQANFILPEINKLALESKSRSLAILLVSFAAAQGSVHGVELIKGNPENGGCCLLGQIPLESLCTSWEQSPNLSLGQRMEVTLPVNMKYCLLKLNCSNEEKSISVQISCNSEATNTSQQMQVSVSAEEIGAREKSPYQSFTCSDMSSTSLSNIIRLRTGNVIFNYRYYNNKLQKTEVTEEFSCPFCLVKCASFKGLRYHLPSSHDIFNFEFWVTEDFQAVNISVKTDSWRSEIVADGVDPKLQTFFFCSKKLRRKEPKNRVEDSKHVHPLNLESNLCLGGSDLLDKTDECSERFPQGFDMGRVSSSAAPPYTDPEFVQSVSGNLASPVMLQFAKTRKFSIERSDMRNRTLLHKRQFFHSHRAQPMAIEQVLSDRDSEDEVDDDVADFEDRRMLDDFVDVTKDEKRIMHLWNSFVRKQRVLADGHIPWACEAFSRLHVQHLAQTPALIWCWRLFMIKLWNHGLLDARSMNDCNIILEQYQKQDTDTMKS